jgi:hypothetical protein
MLASLAPRKRIDPTPTLEACQREGISEEEYLEREYQKNRE